VNASISVNSSQQVPGPKHQKYDRARCRAALGPEMQTDDSASPPNRRDLSKEHLLEL
jgi:hypothetical protein